MTEHCSRNITADSLTGMIFAAEGIQNTVVLLNGPMGCKFYHSTTSQFLSIRPLLCLPSEKGEKVPVDYNTLNNWFFRQSRVPCTWLDSYDYVYGTSEKVRQGLLYLRENVDFDLLVIINSPGASLIGDHLNEVADEVLLNRPCVILESPGYSRDYAAGYEEAALEIIKQLLPAAGEFPDRTGAPEDTCAEHTRSVNVLGLSIWNRYYEGDRAELERILGLCGIQINCFLCAGCSLEEIRRLPDADLNLVIDPRMGTGCATFLEERFRIPAYVCPALPIGFQSVEEMCRNLCQCLDASPAKLIEESEKARALAWYKINDIYQMCGLPKGVTFAVEGSSSQVCAYSRFFIDYLGMIPDCLCVTDAEAPNQETQEQLFLLARSCQAEAALERDILDTQAELVFSDANTIAMLKAAGHTFCGIEISLPGMGYTDIIPKTHMGIQGALFLTEQVLNGLMSKL